VGGRWKSALVATNKLVWEEDAYVLAGTGDGVIAVLDEVLDQYGQLAGWRPRPGAQFFGTPHGTRRCGPAVNT
jgi:hypothetical protein